MIATAMVVMACNGEKVAESTGQASPPTPPPAPLSLPAASAIASAATSPCTVPSAYGAGCVISFSVMPDDANAIVGAFKASECDVAKLGPTRDLGVTDYGKRKYALITDGPLRGWVLVDIGPGFLLQVETQAYAAKHEPKVANRLEPGEVVKTTPKPIACK